MRRAEGYHYSHFIDAEIESFNVVLKKSNTGPAGLMHPPPVACHPLEMSLPWQMLGKH